jgi:hypothetical protein
MQLKEPNMCTVSNVSGVRSPKTTGQKARKQLQKIRDCAAPHVAQVVAETRRISRKVGEKLPEDSKVGFRDGREAGNNLVNDVPYLAGATIGFICSATEGVVNVLATPARLIFGLGGWVARTLHQRCRTMCSVERA